MPSRDAEGAALEVHLGALVLHVGEREQKLAPVDFLAGRDGEDLLGVRAGRAEAEDAGDRGDDDAVAARQQVRCRGEAEAIKVVVA